MFIFEFGHLDWLSHFHREWRQNIKISQFSRFLLRSEYPNQVKIWKWLKLLNSVPFIKKPLVNHVYIRIWSFWLTFTVLQWMKKNSKNSQFSSFLLRSGYAIYVKIWKWLILLNSYPFIKKRLVNHVYIRIWSSSLTFTVSQGMKANIKISQFSRFLLRSEYAIQVKIWKWLNFLILFHSSRNGLWIMFIFEFDHLDWLSQFHREWRQTSKLVNFQDFC